MKNKLFNMKNDKTKNSTYENFYNQNTVLNFDNSSFDETIKGKSFVAISDFHGYDYPVDKIVDYYLKEYDCIYIMGDAIDRGKNSDGTGSLTILQNIKFLTEQFPDRVFYIPGNHDQFLFGGLAFNDPDDIGCLEINKGCKKTVEEFGNLRKTNPNQFYELLNWLSNLPLQKTHTYNGQKYVLAHAFFDQKLYNENPNFSLLDYYKSKNQDIYGKKFNDAYRILWFRKENDDYPIESCPTADSIMIIGHNPNLKGDLKSYDLTDLYGNKVKVHCVDGGLSYKAGEGMLKYDGKENPILTDMRFHRNTSFSKLLNYDNNIIEQKSLLLNKYIIDTFLNLIEKKDIKQINDFFSTNKIDFPFGMITEKECIEIIKSYEGKYNFSYGNCSIKDAYSMYKKNIIFDTILEINLAKYTNLDELYYRINTFIFGNEQYKEGNANLITNDANARLLAQGLGVQNMREVLYNHNCNDLKDYINMRFNFLNNNKSI